MVSIISFEKRGGFIMPDGINRPSTTTPPSPDDQSDWGDVGGTDGLQDPGTSDWGEIDNNFTSPDTGDSYSSGTDTVSVTARQIRDLESKASSIKPKDANEKEKLDELLNDLNQALRAGDVETASTKFSDAQQIYDGLTTAPAPTSDQGATAVSGDGTATSGDGSTSSGDGGMQVSTNPDDFTIPTYNAGDDTGGDSPTSTKDGVNYYEAKDQGQSFNLTVPPASAKNDVKTNEIKTDGPVTLTPNPGDSVKLSKKGDQTIATVGDYTYKFSKNAQINIATDVSNVSGNIDNSNGKVTVGTDSPATYIPKEKYDNIANKLEAGANKIGSDAYLNDSPWKGLVGWKAGYKYSADSDEKNSDVKQVLNQIDDALKETDPTKKQDNWHGVLQTLKRWDSQNNDKGHVNDRANLLFNVLYGQLGEDGLKEAVREIIPSDVLNQITTLLTIKPDENNDKGEAQREAGLPGLDWTLQTRADTLKDWAGGGSDTSGDSTTGAAGA
jgi:hypothetical protein